ncbi:MAG: RidA family protein [Legionellaceae bacterium]|nr:RidA family protein [Legionellaceae bacterium]
MNKILSIILLTNLSLNAVAGNLKKDIMTENAPAPIGTYSQAIQSGNITYISGQIGIVPKTGELVSGVFSEQVNQVLKNIASVVKVAGGTMNDLVKVTVYLTDLNDFGEVNRAFEQFFSEPYPARAAIEIKALPKKAKVEIEAIMDIQKNQKKR